MKNSFFNTIAECDELLLGKNIIFHCGLIGLEDDHEFIYKKTDEFGKETRILESTVDQNRSVIICAPSFLEESFDLEFAPSQLVRIGINSVESCLLFLNLVPLAQNTQDRQAWVNMLAPIIIDKKELLGGQITLTSPSEKHLEYRVVALR